MPHIEIVRRLISLWQQGNIDAVLDLMTDDIEYHYLVGERPLCDKVIIRRFLEKVAQEQSQNKWRIVNFAENGPFLLTEGIDDFVDPEGNRVQTPYMSTFEMRDGKIAHWRDYLNPSLIARSQSGESQPDWFAKLIGELDRS